LARIVSDEFLSTWFKNYPLHLTLASISTLQRNNARHKIVPEIVLIHKTVSKDSNIKTKSIIGLE